LLILFNPYEGLPISPKCTERAFEVGNLLQEEWEVVVLQEIWHRRERNIIISAAEKAGFHYYHYFHPAVGFPLPIGYDSFGTGLLVLSKFPIIGVMYHAFSLSGRPYALHEVIYLCFFFFFLVITQS
jgi:sphingomyelin phosphodiesterase 2